MMQISTAGASWAEYHGLPLNRLRSFARKRSYRSDPLIRRDSLDRLPRSRPSAWHVREDALTQFKERWTLSLRWQSIWYKEFATGLIEIDIPGTIPGSVCASLYKSQRRLLDQVSFPDELPISLDRLRIKSVESAYNRTTVACKTDWIKI